MLMIPLLEIYFRHDMNRILSLVLDHLKQINREEFLRFLTEYREKLAACLCTPCVAHGSTSPPKLASPTARRLPEKKGSRWVTQQLVGVDVQGAAGTAMEVAGGGRRPSSPFALL